MKTKSEIIDRVIKQLAPLLKALEPVDGPEIQTRELLPTSNTQDIIEANKGE